MPAKILTLKPRAFPLRGGQIFPYVSRSTSVIPSGSIFWLKAGVAQFSDDGATTPAVADGVVAVWQDQSGRGNHFLQGTNTARPLLKTGLTNGFSALRFDGSDDYMSIGSTLGLASSPTSTAFIVVKMNSLATFPTFFDSNPLRSQLGIRSNNYEIYQGTTVISGIAAGIVLTRIITGVFNGNATSTILIDGANSVSGDAGTSNCGAGFYIGGRSGEFASCDIYEVIFYGNSLSGAQRQQVERYLGTKYGITVP
jgi:hypothetical protein